MKAFTVGEQARDDDVYRSRTWEFLFRSSEFFRHKLAADPAVAERRREYLDGLGYAALQPSDREVERHDRDLGELVELVASRWCVLYDEWARDPAGHAFDDGHAALLFLRVLWAIEPVLLRGQLDASWTLQTTLARARSRGEDVERSRRVAAEFAAEVDRLPTIAALYQEGLRDSHREAVLQHYGFPTDFLDFTYAFDIALYFAEGMESARQLGKKIPRRGAIYAVPPHALPRSATVVTLPPAVMRPTLQQGVFVDGSDPRVIRRLEAFKFVFQQRRFTVTSGISGISYSSSPPIGD